MTVLPMLFRAALLTGAASVLAACGVEQAELNPPDDGETVQAEESSASGADDTQTASRGDVPEGRLPAGVEPTHHDLELTIDPREPEFGGTVTIGLALDEAKDGIWIHGNRLSVSEIYLTAEDGTRIEATYEQVHETGVVWVGFAETVPAGEIDLTIAYTAPFDETLAGMFRVQRDGEWYALAKSESIQARKAVPGFDEPGFKAPWDTTLIVPEGHVAIAISPEISREPAGEGMERVTFDTSRPTSTYLLSFAVGPFERFDAPSLPPNEIRDVEIPVAGWARQGEADKLEFIMSLTQPMVEFFEYETGIPYPYKKLDIIAAPDWPSGATELASAPTYREEIILADGRPAPLQERRIAGIHAHEIAHMWFGDLVTPPWWDDLWLKEGFATWGTPAAGHYAIPEGRYDLGAVNNTINGLQSDSLASSRAVREPIYLNVNIRSAYDGITYSKGSAVLTMAQTYLGPDAWTAGLNAYLTEFEDGAADTGDFARVMGETAGDAAFEESLRGFIERNGAPLLTVTVNDAGDAFVIDQRRYAPLGSEIDPNREWIVPVCVRHSAGRDCGLIDGEANTIAITGGAAPDWFMPNADGAGYYRFTLSEADWTALAANFESLNTAEALITLDSISASFQAGEAEAAAVLEIIAIAARSEDTEIVNEARSVFQRYIGLTDDGSEAREAYQSDARALFLDAYETRAGSDDPADRLLRQRLKPFLAGAADMESIRSELRDGARAYVGMDGERDPAALSADEYGLAASIAVSDIGAPFLEHYFSVRDDIDVTAFDNSVLSASGAVDDAAMRERLREMALAEETEASQAFRIIGSLMGNDDARDATWAWIGENAEAIAGQVPAQWRRRVPSLAGAFCSADRVNAGQEFVDQHGALFPGYELGVAQSAERVALCAAFRDAKSDEFATALANFDPAP